MEHLCLEVLKLLVPLVKGGWVNIALLRVVFQKPDQEPPTERVSQCVELLVQHGSESSLQSDNPW